jgi:hypothetical protein
MAHRRIRAVVTPRSLILGVVAFLVAAGVCGAFAVTPLFCNLNHSYGEWAAARYQLHSRTCLSRLYLNWLLWMPGLIPDSHILRDRPIEAAIPSAYRADIQSLLAADKEHQLLELQAYGWPFRSSAMYVIATGPNSMSPPSGQSITWSPYDGINGPTGDYTISCVIRGGYRCMYRGRECFLPTRVLWRGAASNILLCFAAIYGITYACHLAVRSARRIIRRRAGRCRSCGYSLDGLVGSRCSECGGVSVKR